MTEYEGIPQYQDAGVYMVQRLKTMGKPYLNKHLNFNKYCFNVGPAS